MEALKMRGGTRDSSESRASAFLASFRYRTGRVDPRDGRMPSKAIRSAILRQGKQIDDLMMVTLLRMYMNGCALNHIAAVLSIHVGRVRVLIELYCLDEMKLDLA